MSNQRTHGSSRGLRRLLSGVLSLVLLLGLIPASVRPAQAASQSWAMPYMEQLVDWGVMRGDVGGNLAPGRNITRAEFVTLVNRAYGYTRMAGTPFTDVRSSDWYAQDIDIAYNMGYFKGTSPTTASPLSPVTREQAAVLLTRNLMLQENTGEILGFSDSRTLAEWSRGLIGAAAAKGVINGYSDGSFRPQNNITRGEVAAMLVRAIGTPINEAGDYEMGAVYGNVTINTSGVNLRNSTITGNLYLTGGVDLGDVLLENVNVLGQIIVSGAGESNSSQSSILLRNVEADEMIVDSISNQFVTIRAEGNTSIGTTSVRTNAYVDDSSLPGYGLSLIELDGESGALLQLAGSVKEVVNKTPNSNLQFVQGVADKVTIDEHAVGSNVLVDTGTRVGELNLDVATNVAGDGDIKDLNVGAAGSTVDIGPEQVEIRPGITSNVAGINNMTSSVAAEYSADPRLQAGYPKVKDVSPTSAVGVFSTNKAGTVYWAMSAVADGSVSEDDLINPPVYGGKAIASGNLKAAASKTEYTVNLTRLTSDGSYYLSAIMVDDRGNRSPLKVTAFSTPDNTTPAFASGYPVISKNTTDTVQTTVMPNKNCVMYYALLPSGSTAPKAQDFKSAAIPGNLGYGSVDLVKNVTQPVNVNNVKLDEQTKYDLYLWLTDVNGAKSSAVRKITITTPDETPPVITYLEQNLSRTTATAIGVTYAMNEPGKVYWVLYADDLTNAYAAEFGRDTNEKDSEGNSKWRGKELQAKAFVKAGLNSLKKGTSTASKAESEINFAISGLNSKNTGTTSYMLYVIAEDKAGNLADEVQWLNVQTLDTVPPTVKQEFTKVDDDNPMEPEPDTSIRLVFDEKVQGDPSRNENFLELYNLALETGNFDDLAKALAEHIDMHYIDATGKDSVPVPRSANNPNPNASDWIVDYRKAKVYMEDGNMVVELPYDSTDKPNLPNSALNLKSGATYYFVLKGIRDQALTPNIMNKGAAVKLPQFRIMFAHVSVNRSESVSIKEVDGAKLDTPLDIDFNFTVKPESVDAVEDSMMWDMLLWTDTNMEYDLYVREAPKEGDADTGLGWSKVGHTGIIVNKNQEDGFAYQSLQKHFKGLSTFDPLNQMGTQYGDLEYAIHVVGINQTYNRAAWNQRVNMKISIVAGHHAGLTNVASIGFKSNLERAKRDDGVATIGRPDPRELYKQFTDTEPPKFVDNYPSIRPSDITASMDLMIDRPGYVYWIAVPVTGPMKGVNADTAVTGTMEGQEKDITGYSTSMLPSPYCIGKDEAGQVQNDPSGPSSTLTGRPMIGEIPTSGPTAKKTNDGKISNDMRYYLSAPNVTTATTEAQRGSSGDRVAGVVRLEGNISQTITISNLSPNTVYLLYAVTQGTSAVYEEHVECYRFTTKVAQRPTINGINNTTSVLIQIYDTPTANLQYVLIRRGGENKEYNDPFSKYVADKTAWNAVAGNYTGMDSSTFTVLDAMMTAYTGGDPNNDRGGYTGTVFDEFASTAAKQQFGSLIRSQGQMSNDIVMPVKSPQAFLAANNDTERNRIQCTGMKVNNEYILFVVGKSATSSGDAFRAFYPLHAEDNRIPMITFAGIAISPDAWTDSGVIKKGTVTLVFNEALYFQSGSTSSAGDSIIPICNCPLGAHANSKKSKAVGSVVKPGKDCGIAVDAEEDESDEPHRATNEVAVDITGAFDGSYFTFDPNVCDKDGLGMDRDPLRVTIRTSQDRNGKWSATVEVTKTWDGR